MKEIKLTMGKIALVDDDKFESLNQHKWHAIKRKNLFYAARNKLGGGLILMHRLILNINDKNVLADHIDHNGLNNQIHNLRPCDRQQNNRNKSSQTGSSSKYLGVTFDKSRNKWACRVKNNGKNIFGGRFDNETDAAISYNKIAIIIHGEFANLNVINQ